MKNDVIVIAGATGGGKSAAALDVCERLCGELISCDSMQIYRKISIFRIISEYNPAFQKKYQQKKCCKNTYNYY